MRLTAVFGIVDREGVLGDRQKRYLYMVDRSNVAIMNKNGAGVVGRQERD